MLLECKKHGGFDKSEIKCPHCESEKLDIKISGTALEAPEVSMSVDSHPYIIMDPKLAEQLQRIEDKLDQLLNIKKLKRNLAIAVKALKFAKRYGSACGGHDDPTWCDERCQVASRAKKALKRILGEK